MDTEKDFPDHDRAVSDWMNAQGWRVTARPHAFSADTYSWRHDFDGGSRTVSITRRVLDDLSAAGVASFLNAQAIARGLNQGAHMRVELSSSSGHVVATFHS